MKFQVRIFTATGIGKYHAISFESFESLGTIEIRALRPQGSASSYEKLLKLFVARMKIANDLAQSGQRIPLGTLKSLRGNPQAVLKDFDDYVSGAGLNFEDYREFVLPWWQNTGTEFDLYMANRPALNLNCAQNLGRVLH